MLRCPREPRQLRWLLSQPPLFLLRLPLQLALSHCLLNRRRAPLQRNRRHPRRRRPGLCSRTCRNPHRLPSLRPLRIELPQPRQRQPRLPIQLPFPPRPPRSPLRPPFLRRNRRSPKRLSLRQNPSALPGCIRAGSFLCPAFIRASGWSSLAATPSIGSAAQEPPATSVAAWVRLATT